jgi:broad specificity phosphatase PhoE
MRAVFIRHGQSTGNIGIPCHDQSLIELTETGWQQARDVAANWIAAPDLIVTSPYLRAQQTAQPTIERFSKVPVEVWPVQEFTYLQPDRWNGTLSVERMPHIERYWSEADPEYCDGRGAESFANLLRRAETALRRLETLPDGTLVYIFSHGQFVQAVRSLVIEQEKTEREKMPGFWNKGKAAISNAELVSFLKEIDGWRHEAETSSLEAGGINIVAKRDA